MPIHTSLLGSYMRKNACSVGRLDSGYRGVSIYQYLPVKRQNNGMHWQQHRWNIQGAGTSSKFFPGGNILTDFLGKGAKYKKNKFLCAKTQKNHYFSKSGGGGKCLFLPPPPNGVPARGQAKL